MKTLALAAALSILAAPAWADCTLDWKDLPADAPKFEAYPAPAAAFRPVAPDLSAPPERGFRTALKREAAAGPNFAGHLRLAAIGCGGGCQSLTFIDLATGKVTHAPGLAYVSDSQAAATRFQRLEFRRDSRLLMVSGAPAEDEARAGVAFYIWTAKGVKPLKAYPMTDLCNGPG